MTKPETVYLPIEKPPEGWEPSAFVQGIIWRQRNSTREGQQFGVAVAGPPVPALPEALSPEARAVLEAAVQWADAYCGPNARTGPAYVRIAAQACRAVADYAATLTPPDPVGEAREALERARVAFGSGMRESVNAELANIATALDRLAKKKDPTP